MRFSFFVFTAETVANGLHIRPGAVASLSLINELKFAALTTSDSKSGILCVCRTECVKGSFVLRLLVFNCWHHLCVTLARLCTTTILTAGTVDCCNDRTLGSCRRLSIFDGTVPRSLREWLANGGRSGRSILTAVTQQTLVQTDVDVPKWIRNLSVCSCRVQRVL